MEYPRVFERFGWFVISWLIAITLSYEIRGWWAIFAIIWWWIAWTNLDSWLKELDKARHLKRQ